MSTKEIDLDRYFKDTKVKLQHIAFPIEVFDDMSSSDKEMMYGRVLKDGWRFSLRGLGWLIMSRIKDEPVTWESERCIYGVQGVKEFTEDELLEFYYRLRDRFQLGLDGKLTPNEKALKKPFEIFARDNNYDRNTYLNVLAVMRSLAAQGVSVTVDDMRKPPFTKVGNPLALFGMKIDKVIEFQNQCARDIAGQL